MKKIIYFMCRYTLIGVTSFGATSAQLQDQFKLFPPPELCDKSHPEVFARVTEVKTWIQDNTEATQDSNNPNTTP